MTIRVLSFDFDGCLFHKGYVYSEDKNVVKSNETFLEAVKKENEEFTTVYSLVGSNRQSYNVDMANSWGKGSCFPAIKTVSDYLGTKLDTFLLADIFGDLPIGTSYSQATSSNKHEIKHSDWMFDDTKTTLIYAQIHKIANQHPNEPIVLDFYDDRGNGERATHDILEQLRDFYTQHHALIPANVTLRLNHYAGGKVTLMNEIKGTGFIDENYQQTVKDLSQQAATEYNNGHSKPIYVANNAKPEELKNRKARAVSSLPEALQSIIIENPVPAVSEEELLARNKFNDMLNAISDKAEALARTGNDLYDDELRKQSDAYHSYSGAAHAARTLHNSLYEAAQTYFENNNKEAFKAAAENAIREAKESELQNHRGSLKQILSYASLAVLAVLSIATVGAAYVVAGSINYALNGQFFFSTKINTDSINKVTELQGSVEELIGASLTI
ncbi:hypothetical protein ACD661_12270 [Legionella lytica]|uniref:Dot/Icm T4SS effector n=1 Tax=Legionella lytica TaxID=96232 RepID=A0ABW8D9G0_9GAMM